MAIQLCSANDSMSPRISFSLDFCHSNSIPVEQHPLRSNSSRLNDPPFDFDFCVRESFDHESSSADELFSDGRILPTEIKKKSFPGKQTGQSILPVSPPPHTKAVRQNASATKTTKKQSKCVNNNEEAEMEKQGHNTRSFWRFNRSSSCGSGYGRSLCPLPLLSRSYSTGSSSSSSGVKRMNQSKEGKSNSNAHRFHASARSSSSSSLGQNQNSYHKPPLKRFQGTYGNGVPVILNVPSANVFGLGSIFSRSRDKTKRK